MFSAINVVLLQKITSDIHYIMSTVNSEIQTIISAGIKPPPCRQPVYNMYYNRYEVIPL
jgi:hypothetical protein